MVPDTSSLRWRTTLNLPFNTVAVMLIRQNRPGDYVGGVVRILNWSTLGAIRMAFLFGIRIFRRLNSTILTWFARLQSIVIRAGERSRYTCITGSVSRTLR